MKSKMQMAIFILIISGPLQASLLEPFPPIKQIQRLNAHTDFTHETGQPGARGWELDYKKNRPGYALRKTKDPILLEPGTYRMTFILRRGFYPKKGLLHKAYNVFRIELWDATEDQLILTRHLQKIDFSSPNKYEKRWIEFSMEDRTGHIIEPRVYWMGLANAEIEAIEIHRFPAVSLRNLEDKALIIGKDLEREFLENGFVVSRQFDGRADETGDAATYTGFYLASLAWKYAVTKDELTYQALENAVQTLHRSIKGTEDHPLLARFVEEDGTPHPKYPSKDTYMAFFFGYAAAYKHIRNEPLRQQMQADIKKIGDRFLQDGLTIQVPSGHTTILTPYLTEHEIRSGIRKLFSNPEKHKKFLKQLKTAKRIVPLGKLWPKLGKVIKALKKKDEDRLIDLVVPTLNEMALLIERVRDVLKEQYRTDLFPKRFRNNEYPGKKLELLLTDSLNKFPAQGTRRFEQISDLKVLASNALIALHIVKTAEMITGAPEFEDYYRNNLYTQDALLKTALDWYSIEEDLTILTSGNPSADRLRKGYLSALSLYNLIELESNPYIREKYISILNRWWTTYRHEDNPMAAALHYVSVVENAENAKSDYQGLIFKGLDLYPMNRTGFGRDYWKEKGISVGEKLGGGVYKKHSREPLPISHRPKGSFLWQRNARRLKGDYLKNYPGTDYVFLYWFGRYHGIIPAPPQQNQAQK